MTKIFWSSDRGSLPRDARALANHDSPLLKPALQKGCRD
jgi:hypothetical protein